MVVLVLFGGLLFALAAGGAGAFFGLPVWVCLGLGALGGSLGAGALVAGVMVHALRQDRAEQPWQDRRKAPVQDRRKAPAQIRLWQERRKGPRQDRRTMSPQDRGACVRTAPEFLMGR